jgi:2-oxoglutarate ferredoxin oxidoreductase subunit alpha
LDEVSIVLAGAAGQGIETVADFMATVLKNAGYHVFATREFMSRIRGGTNSLQLRVSTETRAAYCRRTDIMIPLSETAIPHLEKHSRLSDDTLVIGEDELVGARAKKNPETTAVIRFTEIAKEVGGKIYSNTVAAGAILALFDVEDETVSEYLTGRFGSKGEKVVEQNKEAYHRGVEEGKRIRSDFFALDMKPDSKITGEMLISGTDSVAMGAIAGGCNFIASYPMSPSTGVLVFLSQQATEFGIVVDQAEDEISAMNKGLGAWYAGARAMVTTSGGGFALMSEGLSLAGITETPMVIHLAQRPGPATGLPTRTEQGDLLHVIRTAHGDFPRIVLTPGTLEDGFLLTQKAFNLADKYQVPVFVLTDQYFVDSSSNTPVFDLGGIEVERYIVKTEAEYQRYRLTDSGISPRGIPGHGEGLVCVDSDEHDEDGHITEDLHVRVDMVQKRVMKKMRAIREDFIMPELVGPEDYSTLVVTWGSNYHVVREVLEKIDDSGISMLHFKQTYPLSEAVLEYLERADCVVSIENNATGQFTKILQDELGFTISSDDMLLKYNGLPFAVEEIEEFLSNYGR